MQQVKFGIRFTVNQYAYGALVKFIECADGLNDDVRQRYVEFLNALKSEQVKPSTLVDVDVLETFGSDLDNRAQIDYHEGHYANEPDIVAGGKMFYGRYLKLKQVHPTLAFSNLSQYR